jgi:hypothetical protein
VAVTVAFMDHNWCGFLSRTVHSVQLSQSHGDQDVLSNHSESHSHKTTKLSSQVTFRCTVTSQPSSPLKSEWHQAVISPQGVQAAVGTGLYHTHMWHALQAYGTTRTWICTMEFTQPSGESCWRLPLPLCGWSPSNLQFWGTATAARELPQPRRLHSQGGTFTDIWHPVTWTFTVTCKQSDGMEQIRKW